MSVDAAEYYFSRQDFKQALELYSKEEDPRNVFRIADLKFILQGRGVAKDFLLSVLGKSKDISGDTRAHVNEKLQTILETFVSDEGQSEFYRAQTKIRHGDWAGAEVLLEGAVTKEDGNTLVLELKSQCEKELKKIGEYTATLNLLWEQNPHSSLAQEKLAEAYYAQNEFSKIHSLLVKAKLPKLSYSNLLLLITESELGKYLDLDELEDLAATYPVAFFYLSKELMKNEEDKAEAAKIMEQFIAKQAKASVESWDPLKLSEKVFEAKRFLSTYSPIGK